MSIVGEGPQLDYTVNTLTARAFFGAANPDNVVVTFRTDGIAQEYDETLVLELVPTTTLPAGENAFFRKYLLLTIVDSDCAFSKLFFVCYKYKFHSIYSCFNFICK